jgi:type III secretion protein J
MRKFAKITFWLSLCLITMGCKEIVHSNLSELEANEIVAVLFSRGIEAEKEPLKDGLFSVSVPKSDFGGAIVVLSDAGLPHQPFQTIEDIFPNDNLVGTPFESRVRYAYALSQELSRTLAKVEGVHYARVHVVIPEQGKFDDNNLPAKAAIAIYFKPEFDPALNVPKIKNLVASAVPNLLYDDVSVSLFPVASVSSLTIVPQADAMAAHAAGKFLDYSQSSAGEDLVTLAVMALILLALVSLVLRVVLAIRRFFGRWVRP